MISYKKFSGLEAYQYRSSFSRLQNMDMLAETILSCCWSPIIWKKDYASTANFERSNFLVLDFDEPGDETIEQVNAALCDHRRIIATTKSHQKEKNGIICDRYRLIVPWARPIESYDEYKFNYERALQRFPWADKKCLDGARFYYPCKNILHMDRSSDCFAWDVYSPPTYSFQPIEVVSHRQIPSWCLNFINNGAVFNGSRNLKIYSVALALFRAGFDQTEVKNLVQRAPIKWGGISIDAILKSARSKA